MDDLTSRVQEILGSEEGMKQLQEMAKALGLSTEPEPAPVQSSVPLADGGLPLNPADLLKLQQLFSQMQTNTPATQLLQALRPLLKEERRHKVDEALRMMRLLSLWPALQQSGLLQGLLGG